MVQVTIRMGAIALVGTLAAACAAPPSWVRHRDQARELRRAGQLTAAEREAGRAVEAGRGVFGTDLCGEADVRILHAELRADLGVLPDPATVEGIQAVLTPEACQDLAADQACRARLSGLAMLAGRFGLARRLADQVRAGLGSQSGGSDAPVAEAERGARAEALADLAVVPLGLGELEPASGHLVRALELWATVEAPNPLALGVARVRLGRIRTRQNRFVEAAALLERAYADMVSALGPDHPWLCNGLLAQTRLMVAQGQLAAAEVPLDRARRIVDASYKVDHPQFAELLITQADLLAQRGDRAGALVLVQRAVDLLTRHLGAEHPLLAASRFQLAALYHVQGRPGEARALLERALGAWRAAAGEDNPVTLKIKLALGMVHLQAGEALRAELLARDVAERLERVPNLDPADRRGCFELLGRAAFSQRKIRTAWGAYQRLVRLTQAGGAGPSLELANALEGLAGVAGASGHPLEAIGPLERAVAIRRKLQGSAHLELGRSLVMLSGMHFMAKQPGPAEPLLVEALGILEGALGAHHPVLVEPLSYLAQVRLLSGRPADAVTALKRARDILQASGKQPGRRQEVELLLDQALRAAGQ